jgi:pyruvate/2-oxoglutarate dehydrogenase complex dihydrolipoamide acyltransferase (E2) component
MAQYLIMPKLGMEMEEGTVLTWHKQVGDTITPDEEIYEAESEKLSTEIKGSDAGLESDAVLLKLLAEEGDIVPVLGNVAIAGEPGEDISDM